MPINRVGGSVNVESDALLNRTNNQTNLTNPTKDTEFKKTSSSISQTIIPGFKIVHFSNLSSEKFKKQGELVLKETHSNIPIEKLNKLREEKRLGLYNPSTGEVKIDEKWSEFIKNHNVKQVVYKNSTGNKTVLKNVKLQILTGAESQQLNAAIADLYSAILYARSQKNEEATHAIPSNSDAKSFRPEPVASHVHVILKPSDYLVAFRSSSRKNTRSAQEQDKIDSEKASMKREEKRDIETRDRRKSEDLKKDRDKETKNKEEVSKTVKKKDRANLGSQKNTENIRIRP